MGDIILRGWNWCKRIRHRKGYGVHSPSDFFFITNVVYEQQPFYAYSSLHHLRRVVAFLPHYREKVDKFLFRLVNYLQPSVLFEVGTGSGISVRYMLEARNEMSVYTFAEQCQEAVKRILSAKPAVEYLEGSWQEKVKELTGKGVVPDLVHIAYTADYEKVFEELLPFAGPNTCFIIGKPYLNGEKKRWWKSVVRDLRTGVTFDLYDIGIVFFDKKRAKEHRIVNFL